jgi:hypothetical protein
MREEGAGLWTATFSGAITAGDAALYLRSGVLLALLRLWL